MINRRKFIQVAAVGGLGISAGTASLAGNQAQKGFRVGIIGLDTSHSVAFTKALNTPTAVNEFGGFRITAAYPHGSLDIQSSVERIKGYTEEVQKFGVEIADSIESLLSKTDFILLETNDGRRHFEQAIPVLKAGKRMFIDKPMTANLAEAMAIFDAAEYYKVPIFSASSLRYIKDLDKIKAGEIGEVLGADTYSPASLEPTHPDLFWYGIHGVETLFTAMGTGCKTVARVATADSDLVTGIWENGRIGTFRGLRAGKRGYGGFVYGEKENRQLGTYAGYNPLLEEIIRFLKTGKEPFPKEETLEILAFMEAADASKKKGGKPVSMEKIMEKARKKSKKLSFK